MTRSSRSYCGVRVVSCACGRTSANTSAPPAIGVRATIAASRTQVERRESGRKRARDRRQPALPLQVENRMVQRGQQDRQDLPPRRELRAEEAHA